MSGPVYREQIMLSCVHTFQAVSPLQCILVYGMVEAICCLKANSLGGTALEHSLFLARPLTYHIPHLCFTPACVMHEHV